MVQYLQGMVMSRTPCVVFSHKSWLSIRFILLTISCPFLYGIKFHGQHNSLWLLLWRISARGFHLGRGQHYSSPSWTIATMKSPCKSNSTSIFLVPTGAIRWYVTIQAKISYMFCTSLSLAICNHFELIILYYIRMALLCTHENHTYYTSGRCQISAYLLTAQHLGREELLHWTSSRITHMILHTPNQLHLTYDWRYLPHGQEGNLNREWSKP